MFRVVMLYTKTQFLKILKDGKMLMKALLVIHQLCFLMIKKAKLVPLETT
jgi:hypothetical protein